MGTHPQTGLTVLELLVTLVVVSLLLALAVAGFTVVAKNNRISAQSNDFHLALLLAPSEALTRVSRITVCRSSNGTSCASSGGWEQGWIVFTDSDNDATVDVGETILRVNDALAGDNTLRGNTNVSSYISYVGNGYTMLTNGGLQNGTIALCDDRGFSSGRAIIINTTGRARVEDATDCAL